MKSLLIITAMLEAGVGLVLLLSPALPVALLLGTPLDTPGGMVAARIAGAAVLALGVACWRARHDGQSRAGRVVVSAMLVYNLAVAAVLAYAWIELDLTGLGLRPAVGLHLALAIWCGAGLRAVNPSSHERTPP